jgi:hypothetical protein
MSNGFDEPITERLYRVYEVTCRQSGVVPFSRAEIAGIVGDLADPTAASHDIASRHARRDGPRRLSYGHVLALSGFLISDRRTAKAAAEWKAACVEAIVADLDGYKTGDDLFAKAMNGGRLLEAYSLMDAAEAKRVAAEAVSMANRAMEISQLRLWLDGCCMGPTSRNEYDQMRIDAVVKAFATPSVATEEPQAFAFGHLTSEQIAG